MCDNKIPKACNSSIYSEYANCIDKRENIKIILSYIGNLEITDNIVDVIIKLKDINCKDVSKLTSFMRKYNNIQTELDIYTKNRILFITIREYLVNIQNNINNIISTIIPQSANYDYINDPNGLLISYNFNVEKYGNICIFGNSLTPCTPITFILLLQKKRALFRSGF